MCREFGSLRRDFFDGFDELSEEETEPLSLPLTMRCGLKPGSEGSVPAALRRSEGAGNIHYIHSLHTYIHTYIQHTCIHTYIHT